jgi:hypothetical protein
MPGFGARAADGLNFAAVRLYWASKGVWDGQYLLRFAPWIGLILIASVMQF